MKKAVCLALILALSLCGAAFAEEESAWYELSADNTVLTVRLPANGATGYEWNYAINPEGMELITEEYIAESNLPGAGGTWVASFRALGERECAEHLIFSYIRAWEDCPIALRSIDITVQADGTIAIDAAADTADWVTLEDDFTTLRIALPGNATTGYLWTGDADKSNMFEMTEEYIVPENKGLVGVGGTWTAIFHATGSETGSANISLYYARPWENTYCHHYTLSVAVSESGRIQLSDVFMSTLQ